jgi:uncharacterized Zn-binding protein involved in type VI secretion
MKIIGWVRQGDKTTCGGTVVEGEPSCTSDGIPYTYQGARIACQKNCVIVEGDASSTMHGRPQVLHGMRTSEGCACLSTLNDIDGVGAEYWESIRPIPIRGQSNQLSSAFTPKEEVSYAYDEHFVLRDKITGQPLTGVTWCIQVAGQELCGTTTADGKTGKICGDVPESVTLLYAIQTKIGIRS